MSSLYSNPIYGETNPSPEKIQQSSVKRFGSVIGLKGEMEKYYRELHANAWTAVLDRLRRSNISNFSIYITQIEDKKYLFSYFEYSGQNLDQDMKAVADDPHTQKWWKETDPCQIELPSKKKGDHWSQMEMVFLME